jgi:hypothetical protein
MHTHTRLVTWCMCPCTPHRRAMAAAAAACGGGVACACPNRSRASHHNIAVVHRHVDVALHVGDVHVAGVVDAGGVSATGRGAWVRTQPGRARTAQAQGQAGDSQDHSGWGHGVAIGVLRRQRCRRWGVEPFSLNESLQDCNRRVCAMSMQGGALEASPWLTKRQRESIEGRYQDKAPLCSVA